MRRRQTARFRLGGPSAAAFSCVMPNLSAIEPIAAQCEWCWSQWVEHHPHSGLWHFTDTFLVVPWLQPVTARSLQEARGGSSLPVRRKAVESSSSLGAYDEATAGSNNCEGVFDRGSRGDPRA